MPTDWDKLPSVLQNIFDEITCWNGQGITAQALDAAIKSGAVENQILAQTCRDFVKYQIDMCTRNNTSIQKEGFQIGSPWHGDIINAPVVFLGANPAITHRCLFPRWHNDTGIFTLGGLDKNGNPYYSLTCQDKQLSNKLSHEDIYTFFTERLYNCAFTGKTDKNPNAWVIDSNNICSGRKGGVQYWGFMRKIMDMLTVGKLKRKASPEDHTRGLMHSVLSTEIISWGSMNGAVKMPINALAYFWNNYTLPILQNCGAEILFIVGRDARDTFNRVTGANLTNDFVGNVSGFNFLIAVLDHPAAHGAKNYNIVMPEVIKASGKTLKRIQELY